MRNMKRWLWITAVLALLLAACSPGDGPVPGTGGEGTALPGGTDSVPSEAVLAAQTWLAGELGVTPDQVEIINAQQQDWADSCLELGQANESCAAVITPGWRITFSVDGDEYEVRTDDTGTVFRSPQLLVPASGTDPLAGTRWELVSFGPEGAEEPVIEGAAPILQFEEGGQAFGTGGCNSFSTSYTAGDQLAFTAIAATRMACMEPEGVQEQEQRFFEAMEAAGEFELTDDQLVIRYDDGMGVLTFNRVEEECGVSDTELTGTQWVLESFGSEQGEEPVVGETPLTLRFNPDGQTGGEGGCNIFGGTYEVQGSQISFSQMFSTLRACTDDAVNQQETRYLQALQNATEYELSGDSLVIHYAGEQGEGTLNFTPLTEGS